MLTVKLTDLKLIAKIGQTCVPKCLSSLPVLMVDAVSNPRVFVEDGIMPLPPAASAEVRLWVPADT